MLTKEEMPACPVATTVALIGSKWKLLIIRNLRVRPWRFNELQKDLDGISQKVLTDSLRSMEADGIITRTVFPEVPPRVEYSLSELGESMQPIIDSMEQWGLSYQKKCHWIHQNNFFNVFLILYSLNHFTQNLCKFFIKFHSCVFFKKNGEYTSFP